MRRDLGHIKLGDFRLLNTSKKKIHCKEIYIKPPEAILKHCLISLAEIFSCAWFHIGLLTDLKGVLL